MAASDLSFSDADVLVIDLNNALSYTFLDCFNVLYYKWIWFQLLNLEITYLWMENNLNHITTHKLGEFSDELPDTALEIYKHSPQGIVACLSLCYIDHEHSFVRFEVVSNTLCYVKPGTIELITAFITSQSA